MNTEKALEAIDKVCYSLDQMETFFEELNHLRKGLQKTNSILEAFLILENIESNDDDCVETEDYDEPSCKSCCMKDFHSRYYRR